MPNFVSTANFSSSNASLATVGYKVFKLDGTQFAARTTSGVVELGTATGIYRTVINYPPFFQGFVLWDTGGGSPVYASESINPQDADPVLDGVRTQLRSLNTSLSLVLEKSLKKEDVSKLMKKLESIKTDAPDFSEINDGIAGIQKAISKIDIKPVVNFKAAEMPDVVADLSKHEEILSQIKSIVSAQEAAHKNQIEGVRDAVNLSMRNAVEMLKSECKSVISELGKLDASQDKKSEMRLTNVNNAMKQMLATFERKIMELNAELLKSVKSKENYEERLALLKENMRDILGVNADFMKRPDPKMDEDSRRFLMATFKG